MGTGNNTLPDYTDPPVDETYASIQFAPIPGFGIPHFGLFWPEIRKDFPNFQVQPPVPSTTEQLEAGFRGALSFGIQLVSSPDVRCWFLDKTQNRLIQIQNDRFIHNWRRIKGDEPYPHYPALRQALEKEWRRFCEFLAREKLGEPQVNQCEVTYINHIEYDKGWKDYSELSNVITAWAPPAGASFLPPPERVNMEVHYRIRDNLGRLHVSLTPVIRARDGKEVLQLMLLARGAPASTSVEDVFRWLDIGREWVVRGFADFTTQAMQKMWGRK